MYPDIELLSRENATVYDRNVIHKKVADLKKCSSIKKKKLTMLGVYLIQLRCF